MSLTHAMYFAAGFGKRLLPLTEQLPKPAVPVLGRSIALQTLNGFAKAGIEQVVMNLHHLPEVLPRLLGDDDPGLPRLNYSVEPEILGTAGGLRQVRSQLSSAGPIIVANGDVLCNVDLPAMLERHRSSGALATLAVVPPRPGYGVVELDADGRVLALGGHPEIPAGVATQARLFTGFQILEPELLQRIPDHVPACLKRDLYWELASEGALAAYEHPGFWWEFGNPELLFNGSMELIEIASGGKHVSAHDPVSTQGDVKVAWGVGAKIDQACELRGRLAVGFASNVSRDCELEDTIVMPEAWLGPGSKLTRCIVAPGVEVPRGYSATDCMLCKPATDPAADEPSAALRSIPIKRSVVA